MPDNLYGWPFTEGPKKSNIDKIVAPKLYSEDLGGRGKKELTFDQLLLKANKEYDAPNTVQYKKTYMDEYSDELSGRYDRIIYGADNEEIWAQKQGWGSKMINGVSKGLLLTGTTFLQGTVGLVNGLVQWGADGKFASFYDNEFNRNLDELNKSAENYLPNFYTNEEKSADWYSPDYWMTGNFLWDGVVKNMGFAAGAYLTGGVYSAALKGLAALPGASRLLSMGRAAEAVAMSEEALLTAQKGTQAYSELKALSDSYLKTYNILDKGHRAVVAGLSTTGEAGFEAYQNLNNFRNEKIQEYKDANGGMAPTGPALEKINKLADNVGNASFLGNVALLSATNYIQFPKILGSSYKAEKGIINNVTREIGDITTDAAGKYIAKVPKSKVLNTLNKIRPYTFSASEGFEEGAQFSLGVGVNEYYNKKYNNEATSWLDALTTGVKEGFLSDEGAKNVLIGGLSGAIMMGKSKFQEGREKSLNTAKAIKQFNEYQLSDFTNETKDSVNRGTVLQEEREKFLREGNILGSKDKETDYIINYLTPRIKFGRFDLVRADINDYRSLVMSNEGFNELVKEGKALPTDTREAFLNRLNEFEKTANNVKSLYQTLNLRYSGLLNEDKTPIYSPAVIDKMLYATAKIADYDSRIPLVNQTLISFGLNTSDVLQDITQNNKSNREATDFILKQINELDVISDIKDNLKSDLSDVIELSLRRKLFIQEYDDIKKNPLNYQTKPDFEFGASEELDVKVEQQEKVKEKRKPIITEKELQINKQYSLKEPIRREGTTLQLAPKITVLSQTLGGEYEVLLPNGRIKFLTSTEFKNFNISEEDNTSQEMEELFDKAIETVLEKEEYADYNDALKEAKPGDIIDKRAFINDVNDQKLIDDIEKEFDEQSKSLLERIEKEKIAKEKLLATRETLDRELEQLAPTGGSVQSISPTPGEFIGTDNKAKDVDIVFLATTSPSEDTGGNETNNLPHIKRARTFLNNFKFFKNRNKIKTIIVTPSNVNELGLEGLIQLSYNKTITDELTEEETNVDTGFMAQVFIIQAPEGNFFVNDKGEKLSKVGDPSPTILDNVVFQTMTSASLTTEGGYTKIRKGQEEQAGTALEAYKIFRQELFGQTGYTPYPFAISRGIPNQNVVNGVYEDNHISDILGPNAERIIAEHNGLIEVVTTGQVENNGELLSFPIGTTLVRFGDLLDFANNKVLTNKQANNVFSVINAMAKDLIAKSSTAKAGKPDYGYITFLKNVLYFKFKGNPASPSQISIDTTTMNFKIGNKSFPFSEIETRKQELIDALQEAFISVNNKTLTDLGTAKEFTEYVADKDGNLTKVVWPNYQSFLLSSKNPDGSARSVGETPLITHTAKPTDNQNSYKQKYSYITDTDILPYGRVPVKETTSAPKQSPNKIGEYEVNTSTLQKFSINSGDILFTAILSDEGEITVDVKNNQTISDLSTDPIKIKTIDSSLKANLSPEEIVEFDKKSNEDKAKLFIGAAIKQSLVKTLAEQESIPEEVYEAFTQEAEESRQQSIDEEQRQLEDAPYDPSKKKRRGDDAEFRQVGKDINDRITNSELEAFKQWHSENVPNIPFEILENIIKRGDVTAWGVFEDGVAKFVRGGLRGTEYHEIFEAIYADFLTEIQKNNLLTEFRNKKGEFTDRQSGKKIAYIDATDKQAKERIADDFADFRLGKLPARTLGEAIRNLYKRIMDFFKSFVIKPTIKNDLFKAIDSGKFKETKLSERAKALAPEYRAIDGLTEEQTNNYINDMVFQVSRIIFREGNKDALFNPEQLTGEQVFNQVRENYEELGEIDALGEKRYNELVKRTINSIRTRGISFNADEVVTINDENANSRDYAPEAFSVDWKKHSTGALKFLLSTLAERKALNQTNVEKLTPLKPAPYNLSNEGYKILNFNRVFATLLDRLHNTNDPVEFTNKFIQLAKEDSNYLSLFVSLGGNTVTHEFDFSNFGESDWKLFIQFFNTFSRQKPDALIQYTSEEGDVYTGPANLFTIVKQTADGWIDNMRTIGKSEGGLISYDKQNKIYKIKSFVGRVEKSGNTWNAISPEGKTTNHSTEKEARDVARSYNITIKKSTDQIKFLNELGIEFNQGTYNALSNKEAIIKGEKTTELKEFTDAVSKIYTQLGKNNDLMTFDSKRLAINGPLRTLAELYTRVNNPNQDSTYFGVEGQRIGSFSENNAPSYLENTFNESKTLTELLEKMPQLNDVYSKGSEVLKLGGLFFDKDGNRIAELKVGYIQGSKNQLDGTAKTTSRLSRGQRFVQEINQNINGNYYVLIPGDSSTEWMMNLGNVITMDDVISGNHWNKVYNIYNNYLNDEINLALADRTQNIYQRAKSKELRIMKDVLPEKIVEKIESMIDNEKTYDDIQKYISDNREDINSSIKDFVDDMSNETIDILLNSNQIMMVEENEYVINKFDIEFLKKYNLNDKITFDELMNVINFVNINYQINNQEYHKVLFGDPYQFKTAKGKLDETKRIKSFLSGRRRTFNMTEYNNFLNDQYNSIDGIELEEGVPGSHKYKSYTNTVTLNTVEIVGSIATLPNIPKSIKSTFAKTDETDAMSWLMDNTHKEIALKEGQWTSQAEEFHQWHMAYTRRAFDKKGIKTYTSEKLREYDNKLLSSPMPKHKLAVRKPIVSGNKFNKTEIDLVLDKTSQIPLYYNMVEGTNLESMYIEMFNQNIGYSIVTTGRKVGAEGLHNIYNTDGTFNVSKFENIVEVPWIAYGTQVETMSEGDKTQTRGSQLTKLASSDLYENGEAITEEGKQAYERNNKALDMLNENAYNELLNKLGVVDLGNTFALENKQIISETLMYEMMRRELSENAIDTIQLNEDGEFIMPFEASPSYTQIKNILYSMVNKALISPSMSGAPHVQVPVTMFEQATEGRSLARKTDTGWVKISKAQYKALTEEEKKSVMLTDDTLKFYEDKDGERYCEVMLPHWFKNKFGNMTDEQILKYLDTTEGQKILTGIGFRIPTQALSSVEVFRVKGFLPQYMGYTVVVPSEITAKAGSDFDIDKLNIYLKSIYTDRNGNVKLVKWQGTEQSTKDFFSKVYDESTERKALKKADLIEAVDILVYGLEDTKGLLNKYGEYILSIQDKYEDPFMFRAEMEKELNRLTDANLNSELRQSYINTMYKKSLENEYYDSLEELLTLPENFNRLISPIDDAGLEKMSEVLDDARGYNEADIKGRLINRNYMTNLRHAFITGKRWVGIAAVNITNLSLRQKSKVYLNPDKLSSLSIQERKFVEDLSIVLPHNIVDVAGKKYVSLSGTKTSDGSQFISERLSGYATAFVDIANKPFITKIIKSDIVVSTFMFLESIGAGNTGIYFLNQPIIEKYLEYLDGMGSKSIMNKDNLSYIRNQFPTTQKAIEDASISVEGLLDNIREYSEKGEFYSASKYAEQQLILNEFIKYKILADQLFSYTQATNYDTTKFGSSDLYFKKQLATIAAGNFNLISNVNDVLKNTFIGKQSELLGKSFNAFGAIIKTEDPKIKAYMIDTLKKYASKKYMPADDYMKIANLINNSFIDYVIQNDRTYYNLIKPELVDSATAVVTKLEQAKQKYPSIKLLQDLVPVLSNRENGAKSIQLKANVKDAYSENLYVGMMRELRDTNPELNSLYNDIINVAILQGTAQSSISIRNIIPVEDYAAKISPIINNLQPNINLESFSNGMFERNNFSNKDVFSDYTPFANPSQREADEILNPNTGETEILYYIPAFKPTKNSQKGLLVLNDKYNSFQLTSDFIKVPKVITARDGSKVNIATRSEVTARDYVIMKQKGSQDLYDAYYYKKVYTANLDEYGNLLPLTVPTVDKKTGDVLYNYYYKQINVYGDGNRAVEMNTNFTPSVIDNGSMRIANETSDDQIVSMIAPGSEKQVVSLPIETPVAEVVTEPGEQSGLFEDKLTLKDGNEYNKSDINSNMLEAMGYTPKEIGRILKSIC